ncbi:uncharacterized protein LOC126899130 isoform X2 [Daktulosphaira vitifoliae]|uniref:uncharacterized protein LOC126899130 isoform X2 n=1 Tax=Daktulosphaira vitifoliae TaxID=58002 RepID=UPI0021AA7FD3|nr:uncharacterized protein LOC126899130 isoform X2 [Daktulosphaira vitifoliae]
MGCIQSLFKDDSSSSTISPVNVFGKSLNEIDITKQEPINSCEPNSFISGEDDDKLSIHYVEATAVRTLAANTGSVAILGTTAKCKQPLEVADNDLSSQKPHIEVCYVEATACRKLAAETGSIAILGTTADPKLPLNVSVKKDDDIGSIHYVEATAVRQLAAETGTIAILASTATTKSQSSELNISEDNVSVSEIPVGVSEILNSPKTEYEFKNTNQSENIDADLIPIPVLAMENCSVNEENVNFITKKDKNITKMSNEIKKNQQNNIYHNLDKFNRSLTMDHTSITTEKCLKKWSTTDLDGLDNSFKKLKTELNDENIKVRLIEQIKVGNLNTKALMESNNTVSENSTKNLIKITKDEVFEKLSPTVDLVQEETSKYQQFYLPEQSFQNKKCMILELKNLNNKESLVKEMKYNNISNELLKKHKSNNFIENNLALKKSSDSNEQKENSLDNTILTNEDILTDQTIVNTLSHQKYNNNLSLTNDKNEQLANDLNSNNIISNYQSLKNLLPHDQNLVKQNSIGIATVKRDNILDSKLNTMISEKEDINDSKSIRSISKDQYSTESESEEKTLKSQLSIDSLPKESVSHNLKSNTSFSNDNLKLRASILNNTNIISDSITSLKHSASEESENFISKKSKKLHRQSNQFLENKQSIEETPCNEQNDMLTYNESRSNKIFNSPIKDQCITTHIFEKFNPSKSKSFSYRENSLIKTEIVIPRSTSLPVNQEHDENGFINSCKVNSVKNLDVETEFRLTMIESVREAVNKICEQAVEKSTAIVSAGKEHQAKKTTRASIDYSDVTDCHSSEFSLPPPPQQLESITQGNDSTWPPPPSLLEAEEDKTIGTELSFDLPDLPIELEQIDTDIEKIVTPVKETRATLEETNEKFSLVIPTEEQNCKMNSIKDSEIKSDENAATTIQAVYRGFRTRKYIESANAAAAKIQAGFRGYQVRQSLKNAVNFTATTTDDNSQCWSDEEQKSVVSVNYCIPAVTSSTVIGNNLTIDQEYDETRVNSSSDQHNVEDNARTDAAIKIQARVRGYVTRKRLSKEKNERNDVIDQTSNN